MGNTISNNLTGTNSNGTQKQGEALWDIGASSSKPNFYNRLFGNKIFQHGSPTQVLGAAYIQFAEDGEIANNLFINPFICGINIKSSTKRYGIKGNKIVDAQSSGVGAGAPTDSPVCLIFPDDDYASIDVSENTLSRKNPAVNTFVSIIGITIADVSTKTIQFTNNVFDGVVLRDFIPNLTGITGDQTGSFTATATGLVTTPTGSVNYTLNDGVVTLSIPSITGTSNSAAFTLTGMPDILKPSTDQYVLTRVFNNGSYYLGVLVVSATTGVLTLYVDVSLNSFASSGTKGVAIGTVTYKL
jgi:hypothetical protein